MQRWLSALTIAVLLVACTAEEDRNDDAEPTPTPIVYVAVGASDSVGVGADDPANEAWPQVLLRTRLAEGSRLVNVAVSGATVASALETQLPKATEAKGDVVTVWLGVNDLARFVSPATFEKQLGELVGALRRDGAAVVLVGDIPPLDGLPAVRSLGLPIDQVRAAVEAYNASIARVVESEGAIAVHLHAAATRARDDGDETELVAADGFHPSTRGHLALANTFGEALAAHHPELARKLVVEPVG